MAATTNDISASPGKPARRRSRLLIAVVTLVVLAAIGKTADLIVGRAADSRWQQFRASITASGQPFTFEEIERARATVPAEKNSALLLERLRPTIEAAFTADPPADVLVFSVGDDLMEGIDQRYIAPSKSFLAEQHHILESLKPILDMPSGRFALDLSQPPIDIATPDLKFARDVSKLAELATVVSLLDRQRDGAVRNTLMQFRIVGALDQDPRLMARVIQCDCSNRAVNSLRQLLRTGFLSPGVIASLEQAVEARIEADTLSWSLLGERAYWMSVMDAAGTGARISSDPQDASRPLHWSLRMLPGRTKWTVHKNQVRGANWIGWILDAGDNRTAISAALERIDQEYNDGDQAYLLAKEIRPDLRCFTDMHFRSVAELRAARAALAAERYRMKFNKLPESFDDLVPEYLAAIPQDPFAAGPLQFKTTKTGIEIVSALMDDGSGATPPAALGDSARPEGGDAHGGHDHDGHDHHGHNHGGHHHGTAPADGAEPKAHRHTRPPSNIGVAVYDARFRGVMTFGGE